MNDRPAVTPCLGDRVSALADGSLRDDVRDRALAHTLTCTACRDALDVERLTLARLRSLPAPQPSARLMAELFALGETGGPVPPRRGPGPGMPRPSFVSLAPPPASGSVRPGRTQPATHPGTRR
ncbi:anti-sigma factor, partial [Angustibacter peucedani]